MDNVYLTHEGHEKLRCDFNRLVNDIRPKAAQALADAREKGDLSENAEFDAAREELASIDRQIAEMQKKLSRVQLIDQDSVGTAEVRILTRVTLLNVKNNKEVRYTIVDPLQADPMKFLISVKSPIAEGLLGKKVGEETAIKVPSGTLTLKIVSIERAEGL